MAGWKADDSPLERWWPGCLVLALAREFLQSGWRPSWKRQQSVACLSIYVCYWSHDFLERLNKESKINTKKKCDPVLLLGKVYRSNQESEWLFEKLKDPFFSLWRVLRVHARHVSLATFLIKTFLLHFFFFLRAAGYRDSFIAACLGGCRGN